MEYKPGSIAVTINGQGVKHINLVRGDLVISEYHSGEICQLERRLSRCNYDGCDLQTWRARPINIDNLKYTKQKIAFVL